ncbi:MAG: ATP F0F1 synthase subunit B [Parvibaculum sp.]|nr:ATP F0F1 synthase subunit B [Parvibaculum sp.]
MHEEPASIFATAEFWVAVSFFLFVAMVIYYKVPAMITAALDKRADDIAKELDEARRLREEAEALLASYKRRQAEAMQEADAIIAQAKIEAERLAEETRAAMEAQVVRRQQVAEDKIRQAETTAIAEVRSAAADVAVNAARAVIAEKVDAGRDNALIEKSISELASKLH